MHSLSNTISEADFDSLPPALRRKYFSSLERLRLAQHGSFPIQASGRERKLSRTHHLPRTLSHHAIFSLSQRLSPSAAPARKRLRRAETVAASQLATPADAAWFLSLPAKVQRTQFSREEQILLASLRDSVIVDTADELIYRRRQQSITSERSLRSRASWRSLSQLQDLNYLEEDTVDTDTDMDSGIFEGFRWLDEEDDELDLKLDDYHTAITQTSAPGPFPRQRKPSFRRNLSLSSISFRRSSGSSSHPPLSATTRQSPLSSGAVRPVSTLIEAHQHRSRSSVSSIDPKAKYYRDPEARLKLRVYLASPQKFDEAVEFGFPSLREREIVTFARPQTSPRLTQDSHRTFFSDDTPSLSTDEGNEKDDLEAQDDPRTPRDVEVYRRSSKKSSPERTGVIRPRLTVEPYAHASTTDREMTLHMTLTRPDLRSADEPNLVKSVNDEPLEQVDLPCDDVPQSIWDTLPEDSSVMKKLWRRLRNR